MMVLPFASSCSPRVKSSLQIRTTRYNTRYNIINSSNKIVLAIVKCLNKIMISKKYNYYNKIYKTKIVVFTKIHKIVIKKIIITTLTKIAQQ